MSGLHVKDCSFISIKTAAEKLKMSEKHVEGLIERGALDTYVDRKGVTWGDMQCVQDILNGETTLQEA